MDCEICKSTGICITAIGNNILEKADPNVTIHDVIAMRLLGASGPPLRIELCQCVRTQLDRALYLEPEPKA